MRKLYGNVARKAEVLFIVWERSEVGMIQIDKRQAKNIAKLTEHIKKTDAEIAKLKEEVFELKVRIRQLEGKL